jgi:hypothetical protein
MRQIEHKSLIFAAIFVKSGPLTAEELADVNWRRFYFSVNASRH